MKKTFSAEGLVRIAIALSTEKRIDALLDLILTEALDITGADAGTVYTLEDDHLNFNNMITRSRGIHDVSEDGKSLLPPVPLGKKHICARAALEHRLYNIPDVYTSEEFDFSGAQAYDRMTGYRTTSMLVVPMEDEKGNTIGVLQLINSLGADNTPVPFAKEYETIIAALTSLAAVSLNNSRLSKAVSDILHSFVAVMVDAIDARSAYNANHTRTMVSYAERFLDWMDQVPPDLLECRFPEEERDPFLMSVWLHDIGKLVVPLEIMDKPTRLGYREQAVKHRIETAVLMEELRAFKHPEEKEAAEEMQQKLRDAKALIDAVNTAGFLTDDRIGAVLSAAELRCLTADGSSVPLLDGDEVHMLTVRKGTLTPEERTEIEKHVVYTSRFLKNMRFMGPYARVPEWAGAHHEFLDGSGYPEHRKDGAIPKEARLLAILDIYDALTAEDRPYKPPMEPEKAFRILDSMAEEGKLDGRMLKLFRESGAWRKDSLDGDL